MPSTASVAQFGEVPYGAFGKGPVAQFQRFCFDFVTCRPRSAFVSFGGIFLVPCGISMSPLPGGSSTVSVLSVVCNLFFAVPVKSFFESPGKSFFAVPVSCAR